MRPNQLLRFCLSVVAAVGAAGLPSTPGQNFVGPSIAPGDPAPPQLLLTDGGPAGRALAPLVGKRPILVVYWRPNFTPSEQALLKAYTLASTVAPEATFFPLAALAQGQSPTEIPDRLAALGLKQFMPNEDTGQLALMVGVRAVPAFLRVDAGGVLRAVGGSDITQVSKQGLSIAEALALAGKGAPTPTLGVLANDPIYLLLGQTLPELTVAESKAADPSQPAQDNLVYHKLGEYYGRGKEMVLVYWRPGCPHCEKLLPELRTWFENKRPAGLNIVDVARGDYPVMRNAAKNYISSYPWTHVLDMDQSVARALKVVETPAVFLVSPDGEIVGVRSGDHVDWDAFVGTKAASGKGASR